MQHKQQEMQHKQLETGLSYYMVALIAPEKCQEWQLALGTLSEKN